jgi:hypothetical protein
MRAQRPQADDHPGQAFGPARRPNECEWPRRRAGKAKYVTFPQVGTKKAERRPGPLGSGPGAQVRQAGGADVERRPADGEPKSVDGPALGCAGSAQRNGSTVHGAGKLREQKDGEGKLILKK